MSGARNFARWLNDAGGVGSVADIHKQTSRWMDRQTLAKYAKEAEKAGLVRGYPGLRGEGIQYVVR